METTRWKGKTWDGGCVAHETHRWVLTESHVAPVFSGLETGDVPDLKRWLAVRVGHLGSTLERLQLSGIDEFLLLVSAQRHRHPILTVRPNTRTHLEEHSPVHPVRFLLEHRAEDDGHMIVARLDVDRLFLAVPHDLELALVLGRLEVHLLCAGGLLVVRLQGRLLGKGREEGGGHCGGFEEGDLVDEFGLLLCGGCQRHEIGDSSSPRTRRRRQLLQINQQADVVLGFRLRLAEEQPRVLLLEVLSCAKLDEVGPALDAHGEEHLCLGLRGGEVESDIVVIYELDVGSRWPGTSARATNSRGAAVCRHSHMETRPDSIRRMEWCAAH